MPTANVTIHRSTSAPRPSTQRVWLELGQRHPLVIGKHEPDEELEALPRLEAGMHRPQRFTDGDVRACLDRGLEGRGPFRDL